MLCVVFQLGEVRCAIVARAVLEVLPLLPLDRSIDAEGKVESILRYRGGVLRVLDAGMVITGSPCERCLSTRIVVVEHDGARVGLVCERVLGVQTLESYEKKRAGASEAHEIMFSEGAPVHRLDLSRLLSEPAVGGALR